MKGRTTFIIALCLSIVVGQTKLYLLKKDPLPARKTHVILDYSYPIGGTYMNFRKIQKVVIITALLASLFAVPAAKSYADSKIILGYYTADSTKAFRQFHTYMNQISTDTLNTDRNGNLVGNVPRQDVSYANSVTYYHMHWCRILAQMSGIATLHMKYSPIPK